MKKLLIFLLLSISSSAVSAAQRMVLIVDDYEFDADISTSGESGILTIKDRAADVNKTIILPDDYTNVANMFLLSDGDRLVVVGSDQHSDLVTLYELSSLELLDYFRGRSVSTSPSRRMIAFEKFFPPRSSLSSNQHVTLLYDLDKSPSTNRVASSDPISQTRAAINIGLPVYPAGNAEARSYLLEQPTEGATRQVSLHRDAGYSWSSDSERFSFGIGRKKDFKIVVVSTTSAADDIQSKSYSIDDYVSAPEENLNAETISFAGKSISVRLGTKDPARKVSLSFVTE